MFLLVASSAAHSRGWQALATGLMAACLSWFLIQGQAGAELPAPIGVEDAEPKPRLVWCVNHFPRWHEFSDSGQLSGPSVEFMHELAHRAEFDLEITPRTPIARCLRLLETGAADLMVNLNFSEERAEFMHLLAFAENERDSLWMRCDEHWVRDTLAKLDRMKLITLRGSVREPGINDMIERLPKEPGLVESWERAFEMVRLGRADAVLAPTASAFRVVEANRRFHRTFCPVFLQIEGAPVSHIHLGLSRQSDHSGLVEQIRQAIASMQEDGSIARLFPHLGPDFPSPP